MIARSIVGYFGFGTVVRYLQDVKAGWNIHEKNMVVDNIRFFFQHLESLSLIVTRRAARDLQTFVDEELTKTPKDAKLTEAQAHQITELMTDIRRTLTAELEGVNAFTVTQKRIDTDRLLDQVDSLLAPGTFDALPGIAQYDLSEAGKCIAFERPTAAAFHLLRGAEAVLRHYYSSLIGRNRVDLMWGPIVTDLRQRRKTRHNVILFNNLDNIRQSFRNPTQHPEKVYDIQEVQDLWSLCIDVINRMMAELTQQ